MAEFEPLQPEKRPEWKGLQLLTVLEELDIRDKHRTLNVMVAAPTLVSFSFIKLVPPGDPPARYWPTYKNVTHNFGPLAPDVEIVRIEEPEPIPDVEVRWQQTVAPLISHTPAGDGRDRTGAIDLIQALSGEVRFIAESLRPFLGN